VWKAWGVGSERDAQQPQFINHSGLIYGITGSGKRLAIYAASFQPAEIAHDVPLLAAR
jgi:cytochrome oxidase Cu insertion factor (SCO1/SenC/PrrC family)